MTTEFQPPRTASSEKLTHLGRMGANFVGFQAIWFACVGGAGMGVWFLGPIVAFPLLALHLAWFLDHSQADQANPNDRAIELRLLLTAVLVGYVFDSVLVFSDAVVFPHHVGPAAPTTPWMLLLWTGFAATIRHSMNWMRRRYVVGSLAGAIFGPTAFRAGEALNAISIEAGAYPWIMIAIVWASAVPLLLWLRERLDIISE